VLGTGETWLGYVLGNAGRASHQKARPDPSPIEKTAIRGRFGMQQVALKEAETRLAELIGMAAGGEEVVITKDDGSGFKIIPFPHNAPYPKFGSAQGLVEMSDDFDEPLQDFAEYVP
jgi:antitoxin (DNA-binding transcriptional repressor) of toxin-antitoxin stability system